MDGEGEKRLLLSLCVVCRSKSSSEKPTARVAFSGSMAMNAMSKKAMAKKAMSKKAMSKKVKKAMAKKAMAKKAMSKKAMAKKAMSKMAPKKQVGSKKVRKAKNKAPRKKQVGSAEQTPEQTETANSDSSSSSSNSITVHVATSGQDLTAQEQQIWLMVNGDTVQAVKRRSRMEGLSSRDGLEMYFWNAKWGVRYP